MDVGAAPGRFAGTVGDTLAIRGEGASVTQLSLFSADLTPPQLSDLAGLLAAHGQLTVGEGGIRLSILLADEWRAAALLRECRVRDIPAEGVRRHTRFPALGRC